MTQAMIGVIGGTGLGEAMASGTDGHEVAIDTPFGRPSCPPLVTRWEGVDVAFLLRHGQGHHLSPSMVPYRANIWALKKLGVSAIIASGATGSLREEFEPGQLVLCDQVIDKTIRRDGTFFDDGLVAHVEMAEPFCPRLRSLLLETAKSIDVTTHPTGTYVCMEGPQFSTRAESLMHRTWGGDLIGMTCMPEAKLAKEAEMSYALVALPTDYDAWRPHDPSKPAASLLKEIIGNLNHASEQATKLIHAAVKAIAAMDAPWAPPHTLDLAIWSDKSRIEERHLKQLEPILARYLKS